MRSGMLDRKTYEDLLNNEEGFYKSLIEEYARALDKMVRTNEHKGWLLTIAYTTFAIMVLAAIVVVLTTFGPQP